MVRWFSVAALVVLLGLAGGSARALPPPPPPDDLAWAWEPIAVAHGVDPGEVRSEAPYVPEGASRHRGKVVVEPGEVVVVWMRALSTIRVRQTGPTLGTLRFWRVEPHSGDAVARVEESGTPTGSGAWLLHGRVGWGAPWIIESDRRQEIVLEEAVPRRGARIWETVHRGMLDWVEGEGSLPRLPAVEGSERYLRRRLADRRLAEELRSIPGHDEDIEHAMILWRRLRVSHELESLRPLSRVEVVRPSSAGEVVLPHVVGPELIPGEGAARGRLGRLGEQPWRFGVRGPALLRLGIRALLTGDESRPHPISVVVTTRDDDGRQLVVARLDTIAAPARVQDPASASDPFPTLIDAVTEEGIRVSREYTLAVPLRGGKHRYAVEVREGEVAVYGRLGVVAPGAHGPDSLAWRQRQRRRALTTLRDHETSAARALRLLLADPWLGPASPAKELEEALSAHSPRLRAALELMALRSRDTSPERARDRALRVATWMPPAMRADPLDTELRIELFEELMAAGESERAVEMLRDQARWLNADELPTLVDAIVEPVELRPMGGALSAIEARAALTDRLRATHARLWTWTRWVRLYPGTELRPWSFIEPSEADAAGSVGTGASLWSMPIGVTVTLDAKAHPFERGRVPVLRLLLDAGKAVDTDVVFRVDGRRWSIPMRSESEVVEVAIPAGAHAVRLDAPAGIRAFSSLRPPPGEGASSLPSPWRSTMWPARVGTRSTAFELGTLPRDALVQVDLRVVEAEDGTRASGPITAWIVFDDGQRHEVSLTPGSVDRGLVVVRGPGGGSKRISMVIPVSRDATRLWIESASAETLAVAAKVRRWEAPHASHASHASHGEIGGSAGGGGRSKRAPESSDPYAALEASTRMLAADPRSTGLRLGHAHRLLDTGDLRRATLQLQRVMADDPMAPSDPRVPALRELRSRIDAFTSDDFVELGPAAAELELLRPAIATLAPSGPGRAVVDAAAGAALDGRKRDAFELYAHAYAETGALGPGYAAARVYAEALRQAPSGRPDPSFEKLETLVFGLVTQLRQQIDTPWLRWVHNEVASSSRWEPLRMAEGSAGRLDRDEPWKERAPSDAERLQWALLAPPWDRSEARLLRPGQTSVIELRFPEPYRIDLDIFCDDHRGTTMDPSDSSSLELRWSNQATPSAERTLAVRARTLTHAQLGPWQGSTRLELALAPGPDRPDERRCSIRWSLAESDAPQLAAMKAGHWLIASSKAPVQMMVLGPTVLQLDLEAELPGEQGIATIEIAGPKGEVPRTLTRPFDSLAPEGGPPSSLVLIAEPGPRRVVFHTDGSRLLVRASLRRPVEDLDRSATVPRAARLEDTELPSRPSYERSLEYWPAGTTARPVETIGESRSNRVGRLGTFEAGLSFSRTDIAEADDPRPRNRLRGTLRWRRELVPRRAWLRLSGHGQGRQGAGAAGGGGATLYAQRRPLGLRGVASASAWWERYANAPAWAANASLRLDRPIGLTPSLALVPIVSAAYRLQSLSPANVDLDLEPSHAQVYSKYLEEHPLALTPGLRLRWYAFRDLLLAGQVDATSNADLRSVDYLDTSVDLRGIVDTRIPLLVRYGGSYNWSVRFEDQHRPETFLRHGPSLVAGLTYIIHGIGRVNLDVGDTVYISAPFATRNAATVFLSFELTLGRDIRDTSPMERLFRPMYRYKWWRPTEEPGR